MENKVWSIYKEINKLKVLMRSGWVQRAVPKNRLESVAEHCFSMAFLALTIIKEDKLDLDISKVMQLVLVHEVGEIDAGDITPVDNVSLEDKYDMELKGVKRISQMFSEPFVIDLWKEFEDCKTKEAKFVKKIDKLEAVLQARLYSEQIKDEEKLFNEFYENAINKIDEYSVIAKG